LQAEKAMSLIALPVDKLREKVWGFMGSIYKRGKTFWIQYYRNGKPYRESTKSKKEANLHVG